MKEVKDPEQFVEDVRERWEKLKLSASCCRRDCTKIISERELNTHLLDIEYFRSLGHRAFKGWVRSIFFVLRPNIKKKGREEKGNKVYSFGLPSIKYVLCHSAFCALVGVSRNTLAEMVRTPPHSARPNVHGNFGKTPPNALTSEQKNLVVSFFTGIAEKEGVPNPRFALDKTNDDEDEDYLNIIHLPPSYTINALYIRYRKSTEDPIGRTSFRVLFKNEPTLAHIKLSKRTRGMCEVCKSLRLSLQRASSDERAASVMEGLRKHLQQAHDLRHIYTERVEEAELQWKLLTTRTLRVPVAAISFDYATQLSLPISAMETQAEYISSQFGMDVNLFGIVNEGEKHYYNYIYTEGYKHGSNHVISMVHAHLRHHSVTGNAQHLYVYTDSCGGQNRNKFVYSYFIHRVLAGFHDQITWCFLAVGHTKFSPDRSFGLVRSLLSKHTIISLPDLLTCINENIATSSEWRCSAEEVKDEDFRQWKVLFEESNIQALQGIKTMDIQEISFKAAMNDHGERRVKVSVVRVGEVDDVLEVCPMRQSLRKAEKDAGLSEVPWPSGDMVRNNLPPMLPRKLLSEARYGALQEIVAKFVGATDEQKGYYKGLKRVLTSSSSIDAHLTSPSAPSSPPPALSHDLPVSVSRSEMIANASPAGGSKKRVSRFYRDLEALPPRKRTSWKDRTFFEE